MVGPTPKLLRAYSYRIRSPLHACDAMAIVSAAACCDIRGQQHRQPRVSTNGVLEPHVQGEPNEGHHPRSTRNRSPTRRGNNTANRRPNSRLDSTLLSPQHTLTQPKSRGKATYGAGARQRRLSTSMADNWPPAWLDDPAGSQWLSPVSPMPPLPASRPKRLQTPPPPPRDAFCAWQPAKSPTTAVVTSMAWEGTDPNLGLQKLRIPTAAARLRRLFNPTAVYALPFMDGDSHL